VKKALQSYVEPKANLLFRVGAIYKDVSV